MSTDFKAQDNSGNFTGTTWRGRLAILLLFEAIITILIMTALSFEFLAEELAKVYVVPMLIGTMFASLGLCITIAKFRSDETS